MKLRSVLAALAAALSLAACAALPTPPPAAVGQLGAVQTDPKDTTREVAVQRIAFYPSADASNCKMRTALSYVHPTGAVIPPPVPIDAPDGVSTIERITIARSALPSTAR